MRMMLAMSRAGYHRHATYRQATYASAFTNSIFGCLRVYVLLAVAAGAGGTAAGYTPEQLSTYAWVGQGLIGVVALWGWTDLADRIRSGEVIADLLRPVNPVWVYLAQDLGRAIHAMATRFVLPMAVGALFFPFYWPHEPSSYPMFLISCALAVVVCFELRYIVNATAFWLLDIRGIMIIWTITSGVCGGLYFPMSFLPDWLATSLQYFTPFPSILQFPADILIERHGIAGQIERMTTQTIWAALLLAAVLLIQHRANRKLVIQGGLWNRFCLPTPNPCADPISSTISGVFYYGPHRPNNIHGRRLRRDPRHVRRYS